MRARVRETHGWGGRLLRPKVLLAVLLVNACGTDAQGVGACRQIEEARCRQTPSCPMIPSTPPYFTSGTSVDACIRHYDVACLHGLDVGDPGPSVVQACVTAIQKRGCDVVATPQNDPACAWLIPAGSAADASDGNVESGAEAGEAAAE